MDFNAIIKRAIAIITKPKEEWEVIKNENITVADMFTKYAMILAVIPALAGFLGLVVIGISAGPFSIKIPVGRALIWTIFTYGLSVAMVYAEGFIIDMLAPNFGGQKDMNRSLKLAVFSMTPGWIAGVLYIIPSLGLIASLIGLYGLYLLFLGLGNLKECPKDKEQTYLVVIVVVQIILGLLVYFIAREVAMPGIGL